MNIRFVRTAGIFVIKTPLAIAMSAFWKLRRNIKPPQGWQQWAESGSCRLGRKAEVCCGCGVSNRLSATGHLSIAIVGDFLSLSRASAPSCSTTFASTAMAVERPLAALPFPYAADCFGSPRLAPRSIIGVKCLGPTFLISSEEPALQNCLQR